MQRRHEEEMTGRYTASIVETVDIAAPRERVWKALTDPACVAVWDTGIVRSLDAPADYPRQGQTVHWKYNLAGLPMTLVDRPQEVDQQHRLRTLITLGFMKFDETYILIDAPDGSGATRLIAQLAIGNSLPFLRALFDRVIGEALAKETVSTSLRAIRNFCETPETSVRNG